MHARGVRKNCDNIAPRIQCRSDLRAGLHDRSDGLGSKHLEKPYLPDSRRPYFDSAVSRLGPEPIEIVRYRRDDPPQRGQRSIPIPSDKPLHASDSSARLKNSTVYRISVAGLLRPLQPGLRKRERYHKMVSEGVRPSRKLRFS